MQTPGERIDPQKVYLNPLWIDRKRLQAGKGAKDFAGEVGVDYRTLRDVLEGRGVLPSTAKAIAEQLGEEDVLTVLAPWDPRYEPPATPPDAWSPFSDWEAAGLMQPGRLAPNGLYYAVCRMRHRHTTGKLGRGKFYHLFFLRTELRSASLEKLSRHADVCARVGVHLHLATNHTSTPVANDEGWWVVDEWVGERTLASALGDGPWPSATLPRLLLEIARGLEALHTAGIVFRELAPERVLLAERDGRAVLTDFELAKLLDGSPSVSAEWPEDPFRAPEVDGQEATVQADLHSFGHLAAVAVAGLPKERCDLGPARTQLAEAEMPRRLRSLLLACCEPFPKDRPAGIGPLVEELGRWSKRA